MKSFLLVALVLVLTLVASLGLCSVADAQPKQESYDGLFKEHDAAIVKMVAVMHLRKENIGRQLQMMELIKQQVEDLYELDVTFRFGADADKKKALTKLQKLENALVVDFVPTQYRQELFPLLASVMTETPLRFPTRLQQNLLDKVKDQQDRGQKFFILQRQVISRLKSEEESLQATRDDLMNRIFLFEGLFLGAK